METLLLGITAVSARLGVCAATVRAMADRGQIRCSRDSSGKRLFIASQIEGFVAEREQRQRAGTRDERTPKPTEGAAA